MRKTNTMLVIIFFMITISANSSAENITFNDEVLSIEPIFLEQCNLEQTSIFHIQRLNYSSGMEEVQLNYTQKWFSNETIETNITKSFKSYTKSNTGRILFDKNNNYTLTFEIEDQILEWNYEILSCEDYNYTNNETNETHEEEINLDDFELSIEKLIYENEETVQIYFNNIFVDDFEITYWIEDLFGNILKKPYTTTNNNKKQYTPNIDECEKTHVIKAVLETGDQKVQREKIFVVKNKEVLEVEEEIDENILNITDWSYKNNRLHIKGNIEKNSGSKRVVYLYAKDIDENLISDKIKFDVLKGSNFNFEIELNIEKEEVFILVIEGLDQKKEKIAHIQYPKESFIHISNASTRKKYLDENMNWEVDVEGKGISYLIIKTEKDFFVQKINQTKSQSYDYDIQMFQNMTINNYLITNNYLDNFTQTLIFEDRNKEKKEIIELKNDFNTTINKSLITANVIEVQERNQINYLNIGLLTLIFCTFSAIYIFFKKKRA